MPSAIVAIITLVSVGLGFMLLGIVHAYKNKHTITKSGLTLENYISARDSVGPILGTATLVATVMGTWILFSPAETATFAGVIGLAGYAFGSAAPILVLIPVGIRLRSLMPQGHSLTEYVLLRFGNTTYIFALMVMIFYMFVFISAELTAIGLAVQLISGVPLYVTVLIIGITTLLYTTYGGLKAAIFTDGIQFIFIIPLLLIVLIKSITGLDGITNIIKTTNAVNPELISYSHYLGWETGIALIIGILAANMFHQGYWQRIYSSRNEATIKISFIASAILVVPIVFISGLFGIMAIGFGIIDNPSTSLFSVVKEIMPSMALFVLILAIILVMSSVDSLLNGLVSSFTSDLRQIKKNLPVKTLLNYARLVTIVIACLAMLVAVQGYSVLYLFLVADLIAAAMAVPLFLGLYISRYNGTVVILSTIVGFVAGILYFPGPDFTGWVDIPKAGSLMISFFNALVFSTVTAFACTCYRMKPFNFNNLRKLVRIIEDKNLTK